MEDIAFKDSIPTMAKHVLVAGIATFSFGVSRDRLGALAICIDDVKHKVSLILLQNRIRKHRF